MATHKSAEKRARQSVKRQAKNQSIRSALKTIERKVRIAVSKKDVKLAGEALKGFTAAFDKAASKGIVHAKKASRKIGRLSELVSNLK